MSSTGAGRSSTGARPAPPAREGRVARRALSRERGPARAPRGSPAVGPPGQRRSARPRAHRPDGVRPPGTRRFGVGGPDDEAISSFLPTRPWAGRGSIIFTSASTWCGVRRSSGTSPSAAPAVAAGRSSCAPTSTHTIPERTVWVVDQFRASTDGAPDGGAEVRSRLAPRPQLRPRRVRPLRPPRRSGAIPPRAAGEKLSDDRPRLALLRIGHDAGSRSLPPSSRLRRRRRRRLRRGRRPGRRGARRGGDVPRGAAITERLERVDASCVSWRKDTRSCAGRWSTIPRPSRSTAAAGRGGHRDARCHGRRGLPQHAPRGRAHAPLAVARLPGGDRRPPLRGHRDRQRLGARPKVGASSSSASGPSSATSTWVTTRPRRRSPALNAGIGAARGDASR